MAMTRLFTIGLAAMIGAVTAAQPADPSRTLPAMATKKLAASLASAKPHAKHVWRDTPPTNADGTVNAYIEIARGDRNKWEFDMGRNQRAIDRVVPEKIGGYVVNYGFVPQTVSYDGDPFDALVLGPPIDGGSLVRGVIVGLFLMEDEKGHDGKVVLSRTDAAGKPLHALTPESKKEMDGYFSRYKEGQPGLFSKVGGWGSIEQGRAHVTVTHAFFATCPARAGTSCAV
jgi:inorganic pyrophosphatase